MDTAHPSLELSALEQSCPRGYVRPLFCFPTTLEHDVICDLLARGLEKTKEAIPMLSAHLIRDLDSQREGLYKLEPSTGSRKLHVKDLCCGRFNQSYEKLKEEGFPSSALSQDVSCPLPIFPEEATGIPVFAAQATLIDGGLVLSFYIMHLVADARAIFEIFKIWAQNCRHLQDPKTPSCQQVSTTLFEKRAFTREFDSRAPPLDHNTPLLRHPDYQVHSAPPPPPPALLKSSFRTRVFRFSSSSLLRLKNDVAADLVDDARISTHDAVCALVWRSVLAAQTDRLDLVPDALSLNTICVDGRARCSNPLPENHIGCPMVYAIPRMDARELLETDGLAKAASATHNAVTAVDKNTIAVLVDFLSRIPSYDCVVPLTFDGLMNTSIMMSSWFRLPFYKIDWGNMVHRGHCDRVRTVHEGFFNGSQLIMPELLTGEMEVVIGLDESRWTAFEADGLWRSYTTQ